jgi:endonuclease-3
VLKYYLPHSVKVETTISPAIMSSSRRQVSGVVTRLSTRASPYHSAVTLFEADQSSTSLSSSSQRSKRIKLEVESKTSELTPSTSLQKTSPTLKLEEPVTDEDPSSRVKAKSPKKPKPIQRSLDIPHPAPSRWKEAYDSIKEMRAQIAAPVDTMGCEKAQHNEKDPKVDIHAISHDVRLILYGRTDGLLY